MVISNIQTTWINAMIKRMDALVFIKQDDSYIWHTIGSIEESTIFPLYILLLPQNMLLLVSKKKKVTIQPSGDVIQCLVSVCKTYETMVTKVEKDRVYSYLGSMFCEIKKAGGIKALLKVHKTKGKERRTHHQTKEATV